MIKKKKTGNLIVISGPSGCGKGTICEELLKRNKNLVMSVSMTTRLPREGEKDGVNYYFVSKEEFKKRIEEGKLLEYSDHYDNYYGTPKDKVEELLSKGIDVIDEIEINGALQINNVMNDAIFIFIMPPNMRELKKRLINDVIDIVITDKWLDEKGKPGASSFTGKSQGLFDLIYDGSEVKEDKISKDVFGVKGRYTKNVMKNISKKV